MKQTVQTLQAMKERGEKIAMLTCYDYTMAKLITVERFGQFTFSLFGITYTLLKRILNLLMMNGLKIE